MAFATSEILILFAYLSKMYTQGGIQELIKKHPFWQEKLTLFPPVNPGFLAELPPARPPVLPVC